jgi:murein DD-endopeptidase MepM/ murein hydrolase activator NlpD
MRLRLLISGVVLPLLLWLSLPLVSAGAPTARSAANLQKKIDVTRGKIGTRRSKERVLTSDITAYTRRINRLQAKIGTLQNRQDRVQAQLDVKQLQLSRTQASLRQERARLVRLRARLREARLVLSRRLRELYEADKPDLVTVVLNSHGFADLLERGDFMHRIGEQDRRIVRDVRAARADAKATSARLARLEAGQQRIAAAIAARRDEIAQLKRGLVVTKDGYAETKSEKRQRLMSVQGERHQLEGALSELKAQQAKIRAAAAGRVALMQGVGASGGYGNFTCVQHTQSLATCYAHQSRFATSMGASVSKGQVIGYVGCTGRCFGDHLHFEVRVNGSVVNPMNYL